MKRLPDRRRHLFLPEASLVPPQYPRWRGGQGVRGDSPWWGNLRLASRACKFSSSLRAKAYRACGEAASALHAMALLVQERHLWLNLADMHEADKVRFFSAPISQVSLFGDFAQHFSAAQKQTEALKLVLPQLPTAASTQSPRVEAAAYACSLPRAPPCSSLQPCSASAAAFIEGTSLYPRKVMGYGQSWTCEF